MRRRENQHHLEDTPAPLPDATVPDGIAPFIERLPQRARAFACLGVARLVDYQDEAYARLYVDRLLPIAEIDAAHGDGTCRLTTEVARELALGMAYEDTIRVAELKIRPSRIKRVQGEVAAKDGEVLKVAEFLHPRLQEIAETVPAGLGRFLERNRLARRVLEGLTTKGRIVETTSIRGFLMLAAVARLKKPPPPEPAFRARAGVSDRLARSCRNARQARLSARAWRSRNAARSSKATATPTSVAGKLRPHPRHSPRLDGRPDAAAKLTALRQAALADDTGAKLGAAVAAL